MSSPPASSKICFVLNTLLANLPHAAVNSCFQSGPIWLTRATYQKNHISSVVVIDVFSVFAMQHPFLGGEKSKLLRVAFQLLFRDGFAIH